MNYASDLTAMFIHEIVQIKMLKLLKVFKRLWFPLLKNDCTLLANAGGHTPQFNRGCQVQNGPIHKEESICALNNSSCPAQALQLLSCASSAMQQTAAGEMMHVGEQALKGELCWASFRCYWSHSRSGFTRAESEGSWGRLLSAISTTPAQLLVGRRDLLLRAVPSSTITEWLDLA